MKTNKIDLDQIYGLNQSDNAHIETENQRSNTTLNEHFGIKLAHTTPKAATLNIEGVRTSLIGENSTTPYTTTNFSHFRAQQYTPGTNQTITNNYGFYAGAPLTFGVNNYGFYSNISSFNNRWNFYANGTAPNYFAGDLRTNKTFLKTTTITSSNIDYTLTIANLIAGIITTQTPTIPVIFTLPTGNLCEAGFQNLQVDQSFEWVVINTGSVDSATITAATNHSVVGNMEVLPNTSGRFLTRKNATNSFTTYRV